MPTCSVASPPSSVEATLSEIPAALITHRFPLEDAVEAFRAAGDRSSGAVKVELEIG